MAKEKKRLSKNAKAAKKLLNDSKLLAAAKTAQAANSGQEFESSVVTPRTSSANKPRPQKKRG
jgi:t-SNARE complex subunit (syntaxin)